VTAPTALLHRQSPVFFHLLITLGALRIGGCMVAGVFTLLPGRFLGRLPWQSLGLL